ncbi:MAG: hypothetical protein GY791_18560 [Alphaproteobacteria bacterium]|nr:hypothetical protein [Alphaproteobacteria bacterium]
MAQIHGTCIEVAAIGLLLRGAPGSGKSDLALRLIDGGGRLVADDRVDLAAADDGLRASAPKALAGRIEVRGLGIMRMPAVASVRVALVCDLMAPEQIDRLPSPDSAVIAGVSVPRLAVAPFEPSAPAKLRLAAAAIGRGIVPGDDDHG